MEVTVTEARSRLSELVRAVEGGQQVVITRRGTPVAQITPAPAVRGKIQWGAMRGRIKLPPEWDDPVDLDGHG